VGFGEAMKTVRPLGLVMLGLLVSFALSGCGSVVKVTPRLRPCFRRNGVPVQLAPMEHAGLCAASCGRRRQRKTSSWCDSMRDTPSAIAKVELETIGTAPNRKVVAMKISRVGPISAARGAESRDVAPQHCASLARFGAQPR